MIISSVYLDGGMFLDRRPPTYVVDGLVFNVDAGDVDSYSGTGSTWYDTVGSENLTLYNSPTYSTSNGGTFTFAGTDGNADGQYAGSSTDLGLLPQFSVESWVNFDYISGFYGQLVTEVWAASANLNYILGFNPADPGKLQGGFWNDDAYNFQMAGTVTPTTGVWYNCLVTFDTVNIKMYINGTLDQSIAAQSQPGSSGLGIHVARRWDTVAPYEWINGSIPIARIYNRALTDAEVLQNYNAVKGRYGL